MHRKIIVLTFLVLSIVFIGQFKYIPSKLYDGTENPSKGVTNHELLDGVTSVVNKKFDKLQDITTSENFFDDRYEIVINAKNLDNESVKLNINHGVVLVEANVKEVSQNSSFSYSFTRSFRILEDYDTTRPEVQNFDGGFKVLFYKK